MIADRILALIDGRPHRVIEHEPIRGAADAAAVRGTPLEIGGKSLVLKEGDRFVVLVLSGARRLHNPGVRRALGAQRYRFATREELRRVTGLEPGCVPPFGRPIFEADLVVDEATVANDEIAFSLADPTRSVVMATADWLSVARPDVVAPIGRP